MVITYHSLPGFERVFYEAWRNDQQWAVFLAALQKPDVNDLHFFDRKIQVDDFVQFNKLEGREISILPVEATLIYLQEVSQERQQDAIHSVQVEVDFAKIYSLHELMNFNYRMEQIDVLINQFDWSKVSYDPLEANTEAESVEDISTFNDLEYLLEQMSSFAQTSELAREATRMIAENYWKGEAMEVQIEPVVNGEYSLKNESDYINYGMDPDANPLIQRDGNAFRDALIDHFESEQIFNNKTKVMNENNLGFLKDNVKYTGFGETLYPEMERNIREQRPEFNSRFVTQIDGREFEAVLHFKKSNSSDMYFFNGYKATATLENGDKRSQTFSIERTKGYTAKEAHNLLQGRGVRREFVNAKGQAYKKWRDLDFQNKDERGNYKFNSYKDSEFNLDKVVGKYAFADLDGGLNEQQFKRSLERGNRHQTVILAGEDQKVVFVEVNLKQRDINVYDEKMRLMQKEELPLRVGQDFVQQLAQAAKDALKQEKGRSVGEEAKERMALGQEVKEKAAEHLKEGQRAAQKNGQGLVKKNKERKTNSQRIQ